jgi:ribosome biogenesis protein ERB1
MAPAREKRSRDATAVAQPAARVSAAPTARTASAAARKPPPPPAKTAAAAAKRAASAPSTVVAPTRTATAHVRAPPRARAARAATSRVPAAGRKPDSGHSNDDDDDDDDDDEEGEVEQQVFADELDDALDAHAEETVAGDDELPSDVSDIEFESSADEDDSDDGHDSGVQRASDGDAGEGEGEDEDEDDSDSSSLDDESDDALEDDSLDGDDSDDDLDDDSDDDSDDDDDDDDDDVYSESDDAEKSARAVKSRTSQPAKQAPSKQAAPPAATSQPDPPVWVADDPVSESSDDSDDDAIRATIGNVPLEWYADMAHLGYDLAGKPLPKPAQGDKLDGFLARMDDPNFGRTVIDPRTGERVVLTDKEVELIQRIQAGVPLHSDINPYEDAVDFVSNQVEIHPLSSAPEPKSRFVPSRWEHKKIVKLVRAIRKGWIKPKSAVEVKPEFYDVWKPANEQEWLALQEQVKAMQRLPPPKIRLPGHAESYNPPPEYLPTDEEAKQWLSTPDSERRRHFLPQKYACLRHVPMYQRFVRERYDRCLDLYLCPRMPRKDKKIDPKMLLPELPRPRDLRPFPYRMALEYLGHTDRVTGIAVDPSGQWLVSVSEDETLRIWEISTGRCVQKLELGGKMYAVAWSPNPALPLLAVAVEKQLFVLNPQVGSTAGCKQVDLRLKSVLSKAGSDAGEAKSALVWSAPSQQLAESGVRTIVQHAFVIRQVVWHIRGDYLATVCPDGALCGSGVLVKLPC